MSWLEMIERDQEPVEHKKEYETPRVTTFGSVAELTMGSHSHHVDSNNTLTHDNGKG